MSSVFEGLVTGDDTRLVRSPAEAAQERARVIRWLEQKRIRTETVPLRSLSPHPHNPRDPSLGIEVGDLEELAHSLHTVGQIYPLTVTVRPDRPDRFWIVDGITRFSALRHCEVQHARARDAWCAIRTLDDDQAAAVSYSANLSRRNSIMELAYGFAALNERLGTDAAVAKITGYSRSTVVAYRQLAIIPRQWLSLMAAPGRLRVREARKLRKLAERAAHDSDLRSKITALTESLIKLPRHHADRHNDAVLHALTACSPRAPRKKLPPWDGASLSIDGIAHRNALRYRDLGQATSISMRLTLPSDTDIAAVRDAFQMALNRVVKG